MATGDLSYIKLPNADELTIKDPNAVTSVKDADNTTYTKSSGVVSVPSASTSARGVTKLSSATDSTSEVLAATPKAVKTAYDLANTANSTANSKYSVPSGGIPKTDLASGVQTSIGLADTSVQSVDGDSGAISTSGTTSVTVSHSTSAGYKHIPAAGSTGQFLGYASAGTAKWVNNPNTDTHVNTQLATTSKAYILGTTTTPTGTAAAVTTVADTNVYLDTTAGKLTASTINASSFTGNGVTTSVTSGSSALITSGGVHTALSDKQDTLTFDGTYNASTNKAATVSTVINAVKVINDKVITNQTNILYAINTGAQNLIVCSDVRRLKELNPDSAHGWWEGNVYKSSSWTFTVNGDGSITINGTFPGQTFFYFELSNSDKTRFKNNGIMRLTGCPSGGSENSYFICVRRTTPDYYWFDCGSGVDVNTSEPNFITSPIQIFIGIRANVTLSNQTFYPSLVLKTIYEQDSSFHIGALPNYDLTYLQAQDRASLAEVVDSGAKNLVDIANVTTTGSSFVLDHVAISLSTGSYVFSYTSNQLTSGDVELILRKGMRVLADHKVTSTSGRIEIPFTIASTADNITLYSVRDGTYSNFMICTKAAFGVSKAFVPYRPNYDLVCQRSGAITKRNVTGTDWTLTDVSFTGSSGFVYFLSAGVDASGNYPTGILISTSNNSSDFTDASKLVCKNDDTRTTRMFSCSAIDMPYQSTTYYVWSKSTVAATNAVTLMWHKEPR